MNKNIKFPSSHLIVFPLVRWIFEIFVTIDSMLSTSFGILFLNPKSVCFYQTTTSSGFLADLFLNRSLINMIFSDKIEFIIQPPEVWNFMVNFLDICRCNETNRELDFFSVKFSWSRHFSIRMRKYLKMILVQLLSTKSINSSKSRLRLLSLKEILSHLKTRSLNHRSYFDVK